MGPDFRFGGCAMSLMLNTAVVLATVPAADGQDEKGKDKNQGTWVLVKLEEDGERLPADDIKQPDGHRTFKADRSTGVSMRKATERRFKLDSSKKRKQIVFSQGDRKDLAIYELAGETFEICLQRQNPRTACANEIGSRL